MDSIMSYGNRYRLWVLLSIAGIALLIVAAYYMAGLKFNEKFASAFGGLATGVGVLLAVYTLLMMRQANDFSLVSDLHTRLNDKESIPCRQYLFEAFAEHLAQASEKVFGKDCLVCSQPQCGRVNVECVKGDVGSNANSY
jgi:hypothetical protein